MQEKTKTETTKFGDYIYILFKWKKMLIINMIIIIAIGTIYSFLIPEQFKATSIVMVKSENQQGLGGLSSLLSGDVMSLGSQLLGSPTQSFDVILGVLNSRTALTTAFKKYDLFEYYNINDKNMDKALDAFRRDLIFEPTENGLLEVSVINEDPQISAEMANFFVQLVDSMYIELNIEQARNNRSYIEKRYLKNIADLKAAEDSFYYFQRKYGITIIPEQLEVTLKAAAEVEAKLIEKQITAEFLKIQYGSDSPVYQQSLSEVKVLEEKVQELKNSKVLYSKSNILFPFKDIPEISIEYFRNYREIELQTKIMEFVLPLFEQALVEEQKSIPNLYVIDKAVPPELKYSPKKALIILIFTFLGFFIHLPFIFWGEKIIVADEYNNSLEVQERKLFDKIVHFYKIKFN